MESGYSVVAYDNVYAVEKDGQICSISSLNEKSSVFNKLVDLDSNVIRISLRHGFLQISFEVYVVCDWLCVQGFSAIVAEHCYDLRLDSAGEDGATQHTYAFTLLIPEEDLRLFGYNNQIQIRWIDESGFGLTRALRWRGKSSTDAVAVRPLETTRPYSVGDGLVSFVRQGAGNGVYIVVRKKIKSDKLLCRLKIALAYRFAHWLQLRGGGCFFKHDAAL